ncbi:glycosyltransferase family 4 protein [Candidatus Chloroploca asiatica]|uniref:Glycosyltransferase subfamily 4-like N-terminal domain-containing protein n=1 Tax=Candidatus Chloroploca asiatica TaxID=1506545 RepID=A0A2H3KP18_9CHLR|nr:glycosyltransferase family 4 protein [Candidatus Chloroploca asiatica]PDV99969.1 hypothetical protein A9Q02_11080 [Candidatus Chloroploca asiatica]
MNIAVYSHYFAPEIGAPSARIYDLAQQWLEKNHQVQVITCFPNHPTGQVYPGYKLQRYMYEILDRIEVHRHWTYITPNKGIAKKTLGHISYLPATLLYSNPHISRPDVAIGTSPTFFAAMAAIATGIQRKIPFVMEVRDLWPASFEDLGILTNRQMLALLETLELWMYRRATRIVTVTNEFRNNLIARGVPADKIVTVYNGADIQYWQPQPSPEDLRKKLGLQGKFIVLYIGAHGISQALTTILTSAAQLQPHPEIQFLFVGEGAEKDLLMQRAQEQNLSNVHFHDPVTKLEVQQFYALADICLVPLRDIPLFKFFIPSKMFEIMAMGRPIVASVAGEAATILNRSEGAIVVNPEDADAIARSVLQLYQHQAQRYKMGEQARAFVVNHFSRSLLADQYLEVLHEARQVYHYKRT